MPSGVNRLQELLARPVQASSSQTSPPEAESVLPRTPPRQIASSSPLPPPSGPGYDRGIVRNNTGRTPVGVGPLTDEQVVTSRVARSLPSQSARSATSTKAPNIISTNVRETRWSGEDRIEDDDVLMQDPDLETQDDEWGAPLTRKTSYNSTMSGRTDHTMPESAPRAGGGVFHAPEYINPAHPGDQPEGGSSALVPTTQIAQSASTGQAPRKTTTTGISKSVRFEGLTPGQEDDQPHKILRRSGR